MKILTPNPIKHHRLEKNLEQKQVAKELSKMLHKDIRQEHISRWENTKSKPNKQTILAMSVVFKIDAVKFYNSIQTHFDIWRELFEKNKKEKIA